MQPLRLAALSMLLGSSCLVAACGREEATAKPEVRPVKTVVVEPTPIDDDRQAVGDIRARLESDIGFRVAGKVTARLVDVGASVKQGDVLARLDEQDLEHRLKSAEADVSSAEAVLAEAQAAEERLRGLAEKGITPRANYDEKVKNLRTAEAQLASTQASLQLARDQVSYSELKADFDAIVTATGAEPGQVVNVGQMIVRLAKPDQIDAVFNIAESAFRNRPDGDHPPVVVNLLSNPGITAEGVVREVAPVADPVTRTYQVKVTLDNPPPLMRFGASVVGRLKTVTAPVVVLPGSALYDKGGSPAVWLFDHSSSQVKLKPVKVVRYETERVILSDGLEKGDVVVTAGVNRLREGQEVRLIEGVAP